MNAAALDMRRVPALPFALAVILGSVAALYSDVRSGALLFACAGLFLLSAAALWKFAAGWRTVAIVSLFFAALGMLRATDDLGRETRRRVEQLAASDSAVTVIGHVAVPPQFKAARGTVILQAASLWRDSSAVGCGSMRVRVFTDSTSVAVLRCGDLVHAQGRLSPPSERAQAGVSSVVMMVSQREAASVYADSASVIIHAQSGHVIRRWVERLRAFIIGTFDRRLSPDGAALCKALVLGERTDFSDAFSDRLRLTGLSHVFALSGMNVGFLIAMLWVLLSVLFLPRGIRLGAILLVVLLYMELGRETPSLVRASLMAGIYVFGHLLHRNPSPVNSVACAAFIEVLWRPLDIVDAGFLLSYLAVLGLLGGYTFLRDGLLKFARVRSRRGLLGTLVNLLAASTAAQIATLPLIGALFSRIPLLGILGNIIAVPAFAILLMWAVLLLLVESIIPGLSPIVAASLDGASFLMGSLVNGISILPLASIAVPALPSLVVILLCASTGVLLLGFAMSRKDWITLGVLLAGNMVIWPAVFAAPKPACTLSFISVGNGDATLISTSSGAHVLVDAGPAFGNWTAADRILAFFAENGVRRLDALVLTHPDNDHIGGAVAILRAIPVDHLFVNGDSSFSRTALELGLAIDPIGLRPEQLSAGEVVQTSDQVRLTVLSPDSSLLHSAATGNEKSLLIRLESGEASALLTADVDSTVEHALATWGTELDADLLKVAHHGSKASTSVDFLKATSPEQAVISVGRHNIYGHPSPVVLSHLTAAHSTIHLTSVEGTVTFAQIGSRWERLESPGRTLARRWKLPYA